MKKILVMIAVVGLSISSFAQGSLTPPGAPGETMKTLQQVEPRTPIESLPYYISQPGSYYVTGPLISSGNGIVIQTDNVTVDLNGYTLSSTNTTYVTRGISVNGLDTDPYRHVIVKNGVLQGFFNGVYVKCGIGCTFQDLTVSASRSSGMRLQANIDAGRSSSCDGSRIENCTIEGSASHGILIWGMTAATCNNNRIKGCTIVRNIGNGVYLKGDGACNGNVLEDSIVSDNGGTGIHLWAGVNGLCNGNQIRRCTSELNDETGITLYSQSGGACNDNRIEQCSVVDNSSYGIRLQGGGGAVAGNRVDANHVGHNVNSGIYTSSSTGNLVVRNQLANDSYSINANDTYGPFVSATGILSSTGNESHPWANFTF